MNISLPADCPICGDAMVYNIRTTIMGDERAQKNCNKRLNHSLFMETTSYDHNLVRRIELRFDGSFFIWHVRSDELVYEDGKGQQFNCPWFEPDFSNYPKLLNRLKMCLVFS